MHSTGLAYNRDLQKGAARHPSLLDDAFVVTVFVGAGESEKEKAIKSQLSSLRTRKAGAKAKSQSNGDRKVDGGSTVLELQPRISSSSSAGRT